MGIIFFSADLKSCLQFRLAIILHLARLGHKIYILAHHNIDLALFSLPLNVQVIDIPRIRGMKAILCNYRNYIKIYRLIRSIPAQIIFTYGVKSSLIINFLHRYKSKYSISVITGLGSAILEPSLQYLTLFLLRYSLKNCHYVITLNQDDTHFLLEKGLAKKEQLFQLPGEGIDTAFYRPLPITQKGFRFLFIGRLLKHKGIFEFLQAAKILHLSFPNIHFQILGDLDRDNPSSLLPTDLSALQTSPIHYFGYQTDVRPFISQATCIVLPSYGEGLSRALLEAMAMEKPIISTHTPGCRELVVEGKNGYLCQARSTESLVEAIKKILRLTDNECIAMGEYSRKIVLNKYSLACCTKQYEKLLHRISLMAKI